jgi:hypothetical protein
MTSNPAKRTLAEFACKSLLSPLPCVLIYCLADVQMIIIGGSSPTSRLVMQNSGTAGKAGLTDDLSQLRHVANVI